MTVAGFLTGWLVFVVIVIGACVVAFIHTQIVIRRQRLLEER